MLSMGHPLLDLKDKTAVVIGGTSGIGLALAKGLKLLWFATGKDDFLIKNTRGTVDAFKSNGTNPVFVETTGGHTWINWQLYLRDFAPQLFRD